MDEIRDTPAPPRDRSQYWRSEALGGLEVVRAQLIRHRFAPHHHDTLMIGLVRRGQKGFLRETRRYLAGPGAISLVNPGDWHTGGRAAGEALRYDALYPTLDSRLFERNAGFQAGVIEDDDLFARLARLASLAGAPRLEQEVVAKAALDRLILRYGEGAAPRDRPGCAKLVERARDILHARFQEEVGVADLAEACGTSASHLMRVFKRSTGASIHVYQTQLRISEGRRRLAAGAPLAEIAADLGFSDQAHFTRRFRAIMGVSPGAYRAAWRR